MSRLAAIVAFALPCAALTGLNAASASTLGLDTAPVADSYTLELPRCGEAPRPGPAVTWIPAAPCPVEGILPDTDPNAELLPEEPESGDEAADAGSDADGTDSDAEPAPGVAQPEPPPEPQEPVAPDGAGTSDTSTELS